MKDINIIRKFKVTYFAAIVGEPVTGSEPIAIPVSNECKTRQFCANITLAKAGEPSDRGISEATLRILLGTPDDEKLKNQYKFELCTGSGKRIARGFLSKAIGGWWIIERWGKRYTESWKKGEYVQILGDKLADSMATGISLYINDQWVGKIDNALALGKSVAVHDDCSGLHFWDSTKKRGAAARLTYTGGEVLVSDFSTAGRR